MKNRKISLKEFKETWLEKI